MLLLNLNTIIPLDSSSYLSIIILSISTIYKISYHTDINSIIYWIAFHKLRFYKDVNV